MRGDVTRVWHEQIPETITILRVVRGGRSNRIASVEGGIVERVARPSPSVAATGN